MRFSLALLSLVFTLALGSRATEGNPVPGFVDNLKTGEFSAATDSIPDTAQKVKEQTGERQSDVLNQLFTTVANVYNSLGIPSSTKWSEGVLDKRQFDAISQHLTAATKSLSDLLEYLPRPRSPQMGRATNSWMF